MKPIFQAAAVAGLVALGAQYAVVDDRGHVVGTLVTDAVPAPQMHVIGMSTAHGSAPVRPDERVDRTFHPDDAHTLTVDQQTRAWHDELDRINPPVVTGGG